MLDVLYAGWALTVAIAIVLLVKTIQLSYQLERHDRIYHQAVLAPFPHCDERVLHRPGACEYCDRYPERQQARIRNRVNFTGEDREEFSPCPSTFDRPLEVIYTWPGNRPTRSA